MALPGLVLALAALVSLVPAAHGFGPAQGKCAFSTVPVVTDLGQGVVGWVFTEPFHAGFFQDGLWHADAAYDAYTTWLNATIPRDFHGLNPFDQRACLEHQRSIFKGAGFPVGSSARAVARWRWR